MSGSDNSKRKINRLSGILVLLVILILIAVIIVSLLPGSRPGRTLFDDLINRPAVSVNAGEFFFEVGRNRVFAYTPASIASAGTLGIQVLDSEGRETLRDSYRIGTPALVENNGCFLAFDIGGTSVRVFDAQHILYSFETDGVIVSASINPNGWFCVVTQEQYSGSRGTVSVYNSSGNQVLQVSMGSGFALSAKLCDNNENLAILNLADTGSRITLYRGIDENKDNPDSVYELGTDVFIDFDYFSDSSMLAVSAQALVTIDITQDSGPVLLYGFDEKRLGNYTYTPQFIALHLYDYTIGYSGQIITLDYNANILAQLQSALEITSMASSYNTLMVLYSEGITFYNELLDAYPPSDSSRNAISAGRVLALGESMALTANDLSAIVVRRID